MDTGAPAAVSHVTATCAVLTLHDGDVYVSPSVLVYVADTAVPDGPKFRP